MNNNNRIYNNQYAPGISTYGINGKNGSVGKPGTSIYFSKFNLSDSNEYEKAIIRINQNKILTDISDINNDRPYIIGDLFFDITGQIFKLILKNGAFSLDYITKIDKLVKSDYFNQLGNRIVLDSSNGNITGLDIYNDTSLSEDINTNYLLRLISSKEEGKSGNYNIISLHSGSDKKSYLNIEYNANDNAFLFTSNSNIELNAPSLSVSSDNNTIENNEYTKLVPYNDPVGVLHRIYKDTIYYITKITDEDTQDSHYFLKIQFPSSKEGFDINPDFVKVNTLAKEYIFVLGKDYNTIENNSISINIDHIEYTETELNSPKLYVSLIKGVEIMIKNK
jgi:hypothetical protein